MDSPQSAFIDALHSTSFTDVDDNSLSFIIGADQNNNAIVKNWSSLSHLLIAGATGTGKSTLTHAILLSLIENSGPESLKILLCDTKVIEFSKYREVPHFLHPIASDPAKISRCIMWSLIELNRRLHLISEAGCRSIDTYNELYSEQSDLKLPHILLVIDDVVEAVQNKDTWNGLRKLAQNGRAGGIHLLLITQTPGEKTLAEIIKSSIPARAVFNIFSNTEERLLLGTAKNTYVSDIGEIIFCVMPGKDKEKIRCYSISDSEISIITSEVKEHYFDYVASNPLVLETIEQDTPTEPVELESDEMFPVAVDVILETGLVSVPLLQRRLKLGYARAARLVDEMEEKGIVGPFQGSTPRSILITKEQWEGCEPDIFSRNTPNNGPLEIESIVDTAQHSVPIALDTPDSENINTDLSPSDLNANTPCSEPVPTPSTFSFRPKLATKKSAPAVSNVVRRIEWGVFACGCLLLLGCFFDASESSSDRLGMLVFGLGACVFAKARSLRWCTISIIFALSGLISIPKIWSGGQFDFAYFLTICLCFGISIVYGNKAANSRPKIRHWSSYITLRNIDAMSGADFEEFTAQLLRKLGYINVAVTQASGDQGIDVLAEKDGIRYAIQCKHYSHKLGNTPVQEAFAGKVFYGCDIAVVLTNSTFTAGAFELAASTGVQLWDRDTLCDMIQHANL